jgi:hypothetical protein
MNFETALVNCLNKSYYDNKTTALAYRYQKSTRFTAQPCDVLIDSPERNPNYCAIECKSLTLSGQRTKLYFSSHFSDSGKKHQIERMKDFLNKTGRRGHLAVELKNKPHRKAYILDFAPVYDLWADLLPGVTLDMIKEGHPLVWHGNWSKGYYTY